MWKIKLPSALLSTSIVTTPTNITATVIKYPTSNAAPSDGISSKAEAMYGMIKQSVHGIVKTIRTVSIKRFDEYLKRMKQNISGNTSASYIK